MFSENSSSLEGFRTAEFPLQRLALANRWPSCHGGGDSLPQGSALTWCLMTTWRIPANCRVRHFPCYFWARFACLSLCGRTPSPFRRQLERREIFQERRKTRQAVSGTNTSRLCSPPSSAQRQTPFLILCCHGNTRLSLTSPMVTVKKLMELPTHPVPKVT